MTSLERLELALRRTEARVADDPLMSTQNLVKILLEEVTRQNNIAYQQSQFTRRD
jgi:hypothetical protein